MRKCKYLIILILLLTNRLSAQDITGLWKGTLYNDTTGQFYRYEIAISEEKGKLTGFSHTWFILDDKQYYGVKKVKIKKQDGKIIVEDAELIANNYPVPPAKGVKQLNVLTLEIRDSMMFLKGPFTTNNTRFYHAISGNIELQRRNDFWQSALVPHLQELGKAMELSFVRDEQKAIAKKEADKTAAETAIVKKEADRQEREKQDVALASVVVNKKEIKAEKLIIKKEKSENNVAVKVSKKIVPVSTDVAIEESRPVNKVLTPVIHVPAEDVDRRQTELQQTVYFKSDSLQLSLYDNGEVDGDTVSVLMNGKVIFAKERLSTNAVRKTIAIDQSQDTVQLVMYAENLGTIPPNTGLLVVKDGKEIYEIRFSGDLQKNAAIMFRRKRPL